MLNRVRHFAEQHPNLTTIAIILALFALAQLILGTQASPLATPQDLATQLTNGTPAVVEYFSNLWTQCLITKPIVDGLEADLAGQVEVIRIDMLSELGRNTAGLYGVQAVPTMLIFDGAGQLVYRSSGIPDRGKLREVALGLLATP